MLADKAKRQVMLTRRKIFPCSRVGDMITVLD